MKSLRLAMLILSLMLTTQASQADDNTGRNSLWKESSALTATATSLDTGFNDDIRAIGIYNGDLIVGGYFTTADGFSAIKIAGWNGSNWYPMNFFPNGNPIVWIHEHNGLLYAGQALTQLCSWDGGSWTAHLPWLGNMFGWIWTLETYGSQLYVGGGFNGNPAEPSYIAIWNGTGWDSVGTGITNDVRVLHTFGADLVAGGFFTTAGGSAGDRIAKWNGTTWSQLDVGVADGGVRALTTFNSELIVGGNFTTAGGLTVNNIAMWDGTSWDSLGSGLDGWVEALTVHDNKLIAGGRFLLSGGTAASHVASWDGSSWSPIGSGLDDDVYALGVYNGYLIAGGAFSNAGGYVALWDGAVWRPVSDIATDVEDETTSHLPTGYSLNQNYPNPFNPTTQIEFTIPKASYVEVHVYNTLGKHLRTLVNERLSAGRSEVMWDGTDQRGRPVASGLYFYRISTPEYSSAKKMMLLK